MFPNTLDGADVIFYSPKSTYGKIIHTTGELYDVISFYAICRYAGEEICYLFGCNEAFEVISDTAFNDLEECKRAVRASLGKDVNWNAKK